MFNLLMFSVDWRESGTVSVSKERVFGYTDDHIAEQFIDQGGQPYLDKLKALPCLFCNEGYRDEIAYVGRITDARFSGREIILQVRFDPNVPPLMNSLMYANRTELNMLGTLAFSRNHWAVKDVDLYQFLLRNFQPARSRPTVFNIPEHENINETLASAMMPFDASFTAVYASIKQAANNVGFDCKRADDIWEHASIIQDVVSLIDQSKVVICDCSGRNPNVFYEAGIAHTLGREVILITQSEYDIPFDLRHLRYIKYLNNSEGLAALTRSLQSRMRTIIDRE
ncbi:MULTISPECIES: hypothetical protein [Aeromonas]|uniref:Nucleoside 2-deoxyribosyltransferase n=1 Tax=Aeromonas hydrophila TaxID=644 RepID=A0AAX3PBY2_AERHY|nr:MULTISPECIES: hypothetical protein [Aeromonas]MCE9849671.1 hypothetical protein [Aeromonas allosaccharophila]WEE28294.1 hypothetical protein PY771_08250 [Aeromonas hydrophila]